MTRAKLPPGYPGHDEIPALIPKCDRRTRRPCRKKDRIHAILLANFLHVHVVEVVTLARRFEVLHRVWSRTGKKRNLITWRGCEKIIIAVRARQGAEEIRNKKKRRFKPLS